MSPTISDCKCVLVIGATSGIGNALALAIHNLPSKPTVIVAGRRDERLKEIQEQGERIRTLQFDVNMSREQLKKEVHDVYKEYPDLDAIILSSGVQHKADFTKPEDVNLDKLNTNYISIVRMTSFFLPHLFRLSEQGRPSFLVPNTSSLAIIPGPWVPNYCATKAALHSFALSMDAQLKKTNVHIMEIFPPLVESELHDHQGETSRLSKVWMPLDELTKQAMEGLTKGNVQIPVGISRDSWNIFEKDKQEKATASFKQYSGEN